MSTAPWQPGDPLFDQLGVTPRWMVQVIDIRDDDVTDAARWPRPLPRHDIDDEEVIL